MATESPATHAAADAFIGGSLLAATLLLFTGLQHPELGVIPLIAVPLAYTATRLNLPSRLKNLRP